MKPLSFRAQFALHQCQWEVYQCPARFRVLVAGRRFGKTHLALVEMLKFATEKPGSVVWYVGPNDQQAKRIAWERLKQMSQPLWRKRPSETAMRIELLGGSTLVVTGAFYPDSLRGEGVDFLVIDEYASMHPRAWVEVLRPALADRNGHALFIGTPKGRNHFYDLYEHAVSGHPEWAGFHFTTAQGGLVSQHELASAAHDLDKDTYEQEIEARFTAIGVNRVYTAFSREKNVQPLSFDKMRPLIWALDFNINPMCMLLIQRVQEITHVLDEIIVKPDANTEQACDKFLEKARLYSEKVPFFQQPLSVHVYGDASGNQQHTSGGGQTDWAIIRNFFKTWTGTFDPHYYKSNANPFVQDRVNCVNSRIKNRAGEVRLFVDPKCKELIRDLEEVSWRTGPNGRITYELDKRYQGRTHTSDALGYYVAQEFNLLGKIGENGDGRLV